jgi:hypothetical protein
VRVLPERRPGGVEYWLGAWEAWEAQVAPAPHSFSPCAAATGASVAVWLSLPQFSRFASQVVLGDAAGAQVSQQKAVAEGATSWAALSRISGNLSLSVGEVWTEAWRRQCAHTDLQAELVEAGVTTLPSAILLATRLEAAILEPDRTEDKVLQMDRARSLALGVYSSACPRGAGEVDAAIFSFSWDMLWLERYLVIDTVRC